jgi:hypothetical protein
MPRKLINTSNYMDAPTSRNMDLPDLYQYPKPTTDVDSSDYSLPEYTPPLISKFYYSSSIPP